jgi:sulfatase modifying factor 1
LIVLAAPVLSGAGTGVAEAGAGARPAPTAAPVPAARRGLPRWVLIVGALAVIAVLFLIVRGNLQRRATGQSGAVATASAQARVTTATTQPNPTPIPPKPSPPRHGPTPLPPSPQPPGPTPLPPAPEGMLPIPEGTFVMGSADGHLDVRPPVKVLLSPFWIDRTEVTNTLFTEFIAATSYKTDAEQRGSPHTWLAPREGFLAADHPDHPVVFASWNDAAAFCQWSGKRLPTNAEWEKAARADRELRWPWGDTFDGRLLNWVGAKTGGTLPVMSFPDGASPYGVLNLAGNAWEWVNDFYDPTYYARGPEIDPQGPVTGRERTLRGGGFANDFTTQLGGIWFRDHAEPTFADDSSGFRCALTR